MLSHPRHRTALKAHRLRGKYDCLARDQRQDRAVAVTGPDASTIVLTGTTGRFCTKGKGNKLVDTGAVGPFVMTLSVVP